MSMLSPVTALTQLHIDTSRPSPATTRVAVAGEVDLATASVLRDRLLEVLRDQRPAVLDVDLAEVTFLDCTGIAALVDVRNAAVQTGYQIRVSHLQPIVRRVLDLTGLLGVLTAPSNEPTTSPVSRPSRATMAALPGLTVAA
jgi:anti-anti-sigma factor